MQRRLFLQQMAAIPVGAWASVSPALAAVAPPPPQTEVTAARTRALVCIYLLGGNDSLNSLVPLDDSTFALYQRARGSLALARDQMAVIDAGRYGMHPALTPLQAAFEARQMAWVLNVGTLQAPVTRAQLMADRSGALLPVNLFSHNDQQSLWESAGHNTQERSGWAGRLAQRLDGYPVWSFGDAGRLGSNQQMTALSLPLPGDEFVVDGLVNRPAYEYAAKRLAMRFSERTSNHALLQRFNLVRQEALHYSQRLAPLLQAPADSAQDALLYAHFEQLSGHLNSTIARQLFQVARMLQHPELMGHGRHLFVVSLGGFDTHSNQAQVHAQLLQQLAAAQHAFHSAMQALGLHQQVTSCTLSEFGRTVLANGNRGTDHGWGGHHWVMGGAVAGGRLIGRYPNLLAGGDDDVGWRSGEQVGRWIPDFAVDQYAATLAQWLGVADAELATIFPALANTASPSLGFMST